MEFEIGYTVHAEMSITIEAESEEEAKQKLIDGEVDLSESLCGGKVTEDMIKWVERIGGDRA